MSSGFVAIYSFFCLKSCCIFVEYCGGRTRAICWGMAAWTGMKPWAQQTHTEGLNLLFVKFQFTTFWKWNSCSTLIWWQIVRFGILKFLIDREMFLTYCKPTNVCRILILRISRVTWKCFYFYLRKYG